MPIRTLIVDDEPLARLNLLTLLHDEADFELVGECADAAAAAAVQAIARLQPQLLFLDVQMPGLNGFDVLRASRSQSQSQSQPLPLPAVVFVTAHEKFALQAFDVQALDYLLKPFRRDRFEATLDLARKRLQLAAEPAAVSASWPPCRPVPGEPLHMIVKCGAQWVFVRFAELAFIRAAANYVTLHVGPATHDVRGTMADMEKCLPPERFLRIHRSYIVQVAALQALQPVGGGEYTALLRSGRELPVGSSYAARIRDALALAHIPRFGGAQQAGGI
jgi:two-component system, LytTR family, response regulator